MKRTVLRVGLVGAGPWAEMLHAPMLAAGPETLLAGVWARREGAAEKISANYGVSAFDDLDELFDACDAVAFAVPPDVQVNIGARAARAGKALLLEKPLALTLESAEAFVRVVEECGVATQMVLTWRYTDEADSFITRSKASKIIGARGFFLTGSILGGPFATPWRVQTGGLLDLAPHVLDLLDASLGSIIGVRAHGRSTNWVGLSIDHESGLVSDVSISASVPLERMRAGAEVYTSTGAIEFDAVSAVSSRNWAKITTEFAATAAGTSHPLDIHRGLYLQRLITRAQAELEAWGSI